MIVIELLTILFIGNKSACMHFMLEFGSVEDYRITVEVQK